MSSCDLPARVTLPASKESDTAYFQQMCLSRVLVSGTATVSMRCFAAVLVGAGMWAGHQDASLPGGTRIWTGVSEGGPADSGLCGAVGRIDPVGWVSGTGATASGIEQSKTGRCEACGGGLFATVPRKTRYAPHWDRP